MLFPFSVLRQMYWPSSPASTVTNHLLLKGWSISSHWKWYVSTDSAPIENQKLCRTLQEMGKHNLFYLKTMFSCYTLRNLFSKSPFFQIFNSFLMLESVMSWYCWNIYFKEYSQWVVHLALLYVINCCCWVKYYAKTFKQIHLENNNHQFHLDRSLLQQRFNEIVILLIHTNTWILFVRNFCHSFSLKYRDYAKSFVLIILSLPCLQQT